MTKALKSALKKQKKSTKREVLQIAGTLGIPIGGQRRVEVPNRNSFVYVKLRDNQNEVIQAFNNKVAPSYGLPVIVERQATRYVVVSVDTIRYQNNWTGQSPYLPRHGNTHSFDTDTGGGGDVVWVHSRQFMPELIIPSGSSGGPNVLLSPYPLKTEDGWKYVGNTGTEDLTPYKPTITGAFARMVLVYLDIESGNPYLKMNSGSYFAASITGAAAVTPYIPPIADPNHIPLAAVRLVTGTSVIGWDNIYDVRQFVRPVPTGTSPNTPSDNIFFFTDTAAGVGSYDSMVEVRPTGTDSFYIETVSATGTLIGAWITDANVPNASFITDGAYHLHVVASRIGGTKDARLKYVLSRRSNTGVETILLTSSPSEILPDSDVDVDMISVEGEKVINPSDRLVLRVVGIQEGSGTDPTVAVTIQGTTYARLEIPAMASEGGGGITGIDIQDEGVSQGEATAINFVGANVSATVSGGVARVFITGSTGGVANLTGTSIGTPNAVALTSSLGYLYADPQFGWGFNGSTFFLEFGKNVAGKESNAGKMGYALFDSDFDIVGAGTAGGNRWVRIYDNLRASVLQGQHQNTSLLSTYTYMNATGSMVPAYPNAPEKSSNVTGSDHLLGLNSLSSYNSVRIPLINIIPTFETNANDIFRANNAGTSAFVGTIATLPGGATLTYNVSSGNENAMVPASTSQLAKMRLYNTTRGTNALISDCNTGTNTLTLTANVPAGWQVGDTITIASQTVSGGTGNWVDLQITSGPTGKNGLFINLQFFDSGTLTALEFVRLHPFETFGAGKVFALAAFVSTYTSSAVVPIRIVGDMLTISWIASGAATARPVLREMGYFPV